MAEQAKERGMIFGAESIRTILDGGRKTQTRRVIKAPSFMYLYGRQPCWEKAFVDPGSTFVFGPGPYLKLPYGGGDYQDPDEVTARVRLPYQPGQIVYVKETFAPGDSKDPPEFVWYKADNSLRNIDGVKLDAFALAEPKWKSAMFMPRLLSRLRLQICDVRAERLQSISEEDAIAEGIERQSSNSRFWKSYASIGCFLSAVNSYRDLWDSINSKTAPWSSNPWVFVYTFRRVEGEA